MRVGLLGGSFDPIHHGHLAIADEAHAALGLDQILIVPTVQQPLKPGGAHASFAHRFAMVRLACESNPLFVPSDQEVHLPAPSYTINTLAALAAPDRELFLILGTDAAASLPRWQRAAEIAAAAQVVVVGRPGVALGEDALLEQLPALRDRLTLVAGPQLEIASSELRGRIAAGRPVRYLVPDSVAAYIAAHGLYR